MHNQHVSVDRLNVSIMVLMIHGTQFPGVKLHADKKSSMDGFAQFGGGHFSNLSNGMSVIYSKICNVASFLRISMKSSPQIYSRPV